MGIMQPYFFPYFGYFQLIAQSDIIVLHDDVQYIKGGWVNRNRILTQGAPRWLTFSVLKAPHHLRINERQYQRGQGAAEKLLQSIEAAYRRAPHFVETFPLLREIMQFEDDNVAAFNGHLVCRLADHLGIRTRILVSSELDKADQLTGQERVVDICKRLGASLYINPIGGVDLYQAERFREGGIKLRFLKPRKISYPQIDDPPVGNLSIIDVMMFNDRSAISALLDECSLVCAEG